METIKCKTDSKNPAESKILSQVSDMDKKIIVNKISIKSEPTNKIMQERSKVESKSSKGSPAMPADNDTLSEMSSTISIGFADTGPLEKGRTENEEYADFVFDPGCLDSVCSKSFRDLCCFAVICQAHRRIALQKYQSRFHFLPSVPIYNDDSFGKALDGLHEIIVVNRRAKITPVQLLDIWRMRQPNTNRLVQRFTFRTVMYFDEPKKDRDGCCEDTGTIMWCNQDELERYLNPWTVVATNDVHLWGIEPLRILRSTPGRFPLEHSFHETDEVLEPVLGKDSFESQLLAKINYDEWDVRSLYTEFVNHCFPSEAMTFTSFMVFANKLSLFGPFNLVQLRMLFVSFDCRRNNFLTFQELLIGFAQMEDSIIEYSEQMEKESKTNFFDKRLEAIIRFYDTNNDGLIDRKEFTVMLNDFHQKISLLLYDKNLIPQWLQVETSLNEMVENLFKKYGKPNDKSNSGFDKATLKKVIKEFPKVIDVDRQYDLWNTLYQLPFDILTYSGVKFCYQKTFRQSFYNVCTQEKYMETCHSCSSIRYALSNQVACLSRNGETVNIIRLEPSSTSVPLTFAVDIPEQEIYLLTNDIIIKLQRFAAFLFNEQSDATEYTENDTEMVANWFFSSQAEMFDSIKKVVQATLDIFSTEKRVIQVEPPCYMFGDIHGNFKDLVFYMQYFWKCSPFFNKGKYVFLGDYVDRGCYGIEVIIFLFCYKILAPDNFFLVRGNHEIREVQEQFSFLNECNERLSIELWELINDCFDRMPVAGVVGERIYCAHGGIPASVTTVEQLQDVPTPLYNPLQQSIEAWEIFWNDPINEGDLASLPDNEKNFLMTSQGFARNIKRGTAYLYSEEAVDKFFKKNHLDFILRGHEVFQDGFYFYSRGKVITVFSSSKYSFVDNTAAVLLVSQNKVRVIMIEPTD